MKKFDKEYSTQYTPANLLKRFACCPKDNNHHKEEYICNLIEAWGYKITRQKQFDGCFDKKNLLFDCYIEDFNVLIEYDGEQHYYPVKFGSKTLKEAEMKFKYTKRHDEIKDEFCLKNKIPLIRIPYWEYENVDSYLFDELVKIRVIDEITA